MLRTEGKKIKRPAKNEKLKKKINKLWKEELGYIKGLFPHDLKPHEKLDLAYSHGLLSFCNRELDPEQALGWKLGNLAAGIEILGVGCDFHLLDASNSLDNDATTDDTYTLNLLFGDVFYSRAINYLLRYEDSLVFEEVINSLKHLHKSRLFLHHRLLKAIDARGLLGDIIDDSSLLLGINSLFKGCFLIGWGIFWSGKKESVEELGSLYGIINHMTMVKSLQELESLLKILGSKLSIDTDMALLEEKKDFILNQLSAIISQLDKSWLKTTFYGILDIVLARG